MPTAESQSMAEGSAKITRENESRKDKKGRAGNWQGGKEWHLEEVEGEKKARFLKSSDSKIN